MVSDGGKLKALSEFPPPRQEILKVKLAAQPEVARRKKNKGKLQDLKWIPASQTVWTRLSNSL